MHFLHGEIATVGEPRPRLLGVVATGYRLLRPRFQMADTKLKRLQEWHRVLMQGGRPQSIVIGQMVDGDISWRIERRGKEVWRVLENLKRFEKVVGKCKESRRTVNNRLLVSSKFQNPQRGHGRTSSQRLVPVRTTETMTVSCPEAPVQGNLCSGGLEVLGDSEETEVFAVMAIQILLVE